MTQIPDKNYFRIDEVARLIDQPIGRVVWWIRRDAIRVVYFGREMRIARDELQKIMRHGVRVPKTVKEKRRKITL